MLIAMKLFMSSIWAFLLPSLRIYATETGIALAKSAVKAVRYASAIGGVSGTERRKAAAAYVMQDLKEQGILSIAKNLVYAAVVAAYEKEYGSKP